jgi:hypothetical protein
VSLHPTLDPQLTGNVGLYYCCYRLSLIGEYSSGRDNPLCLGRQVAQPFADGCRIAMPLGVRTSRRFGTSIAGLRP